MVTSENPNGTISNSDLELAGGLLHLEASSQTFDIRERTVLSETNNLNTLYWQRHRLLPSHCSGPPLQPPSHLYKVHFIHKVNRRVPTHQDTPPFPATTLQWPSIPTSKPYCTKYTPYTKSNAKFQLTNLTPWAMPPGMDRLVPYDAIKRSKSIWGPRSI